jgi:hypothetical protein
LRGVFARNEAYAWIKGWESFEPWLSRIETICEKEIWLQAGGIPPEWYGSEWGALESLGLELLTRRTRVRELITCFRSSPRSPFPGWIEN